MKGSTSSSSASHPTSAGSNGTECPENFAKTTAGSSDISRKAATDVAPPSAAVAKLPPSSTSSRSPPPVAAVTKRFMNPLAEREALAERRQRGADANRTRVHSSLVEMSLGPQEIAEIGAMGLILCSKAHPFLVDHSSSSASAVVRGGGKALETLKDVDLHWLLASVQGMLSPAKLRTLRDHAKHYLPSDPLHPHRHPVIVKPRIRLSNEDARVIFRSGGTRSGVFGVFHWAFEEETIEGSQPNTVTHSHHLLDPIEDFILTEDANEQRADDGGMMIPSDLRHLLEEKPPHDRGDGFDDAGAHCAYGRRNLLTLTQLRMWAFHNDPHQQQAESAVSPQRHSGQQPSHHNATTLIDSPRSAYVLLRNGFPASGLAKTADLLMEKRRERQIAALQDEYRELCCRVSQFDMVKQLMHSIVASDQHTHTKSQQPSSPEVPSRQSTPQTSSQTMPKPLDHSTVVKTLEERNVKAATSKSTHMSRVIERHREQLAYVWGKQLSALAEEEKKEKYVKETVERVNNEKRLKAIGVLKSETSIRRKGQGNRSLSSGDGSRVDDLREEHLEAVSPVKQPSRNMYDESPADSLFAETQRPHSSSEVLPASPSVHTKGATTRSATSLSGILESSLHLIKKGPPRAGSQSTKTPLEIVREQYKEREATRIKELEEALVRKDAAARNCQLRKKEKLELMQKEQLARMTEVKEKCHRVKRSDEFQNILLMYHQAEETAETEGFLQAQRKLNAELRDTQNVTRILEKETRTVFSSSQTTLLKSLHSEEKHRAMQRKLLEMRAAVSLTPTASGSVIGSRPALLGSPDASIQSTVMTTQASGNDTSHQLTAQRSLSPLQRELLASAVKKSSRRFNPDMLLHTKERLAALLTKEAEMEGQWRDIV